MNVLGVSVSADAIVGLFGVVLGIVISLIIDIVKTKIGTVGVVATAAIIEPIEYTEQGYIARANATVNIIITNNKNITASLYDWKIYVGDEKYKFSLVDDECELDKKFLGVLTLGPKEVRKTILTGILDFKTFEIFYDDFELIRKPEYAGVGKVKEINGIEIGYMCNGRKKENAITPAKFIYSKQKYRK